MLGPGPGLLPEGRWLRARVPIPLRTASQKKCRSNPVPAITSSTEKAQIRGEPLLRLLSNSVSVSYITAKYSGIRLRPLSNDTPDALRSFNYQNCYQEPKNQIDQND